MNTCLALHGLEVLLICGCDTFGFTGERSLACFSAEYEAGPFSLYCHCPPALKIHLVAPDRRPMGRYSAAYCNAKNWNSIVNIYLSFWKATPFSCVWSWREKDRWPSEKGAVRRERRYGERGNVCTSPFISRIADAIRMNGCTFQPFPGGLWICKVTRTISKSPLPT